MKNAKKTTVKAIIKYNMIDRQEVAYFRVSGKFYKMLSPTNIRPLVAGDAATVFANYTGKGKIGTAVLTDEQLEYDGKTIEFNFQPFNVPTKKINL